MDPFSLAEDDSTAEEAVDDLYIEAIKESFNKMKQDPNFKYLSEVDD